MFVNKYIVYVHYDTYTKNAKIDNGENLFANIYEGDQNHLLSLFSTEEILHSRLFLHSLNNWDWKSHDKNPTNCTH